MGRSSGVFMN